MGECRESLFLSGLQKSDEFACLDYCKSGNTFTFGLIELSASKGLDFFVVVLNIQISKYPDIQNIQIIQNIQEIN